MNCVPYRCFAFTVFLCGVGPVAAGEADNLSRGPALVRDHDGRLPPQLVTRTETDLLRPFAGESPGWGNNRFAMPLQQESWRLDSRRSLLVNALAIQWQHSLNADNLLSLGARYGGSLYSEPELPGVSGTAASLSWSTLFGGDSRVIGRLYAGDEETRESSNGNTGQRFYGVQVEGRYGLWRDHAPFASLKWQRRNVELPVTTTTTMTGPLWRRESFSSLGAGWNWQVSPSWDVRAEASYRLTDDSAEAVEYDRTQLYFSTRYGFR